MVPILPLYPHSARRSRLRSSPHDPCFMDASNQRVVLPPATDGLLEKPHPDRNGSGAVDVMEIQSCYYERAQQACIGHNGLA